jgi:hypothetical protein
LAETLRTQPDGCSTPGWTSDGWAAHHLRHQGKAEDGAMARGINPQDPYPLKVAKLLPAEVTAGYTAINAYLSDDIENWLLLLLFGFILMVICFYLIRWQTKNTLQAILTSLSFVIWAASVSAFYYGTSRERAVLGSILVLVSILLPRFASKKKTRSK